MPAVRSFVVFPALPEPLKDLELIARNLFWSWNPEIIDLFKRIDCNLWVLCGRNPVKLLGSVSQERLESLAANQGFVCEIRRAVEKLRLYLDVGPGFGGDGSPGSEPVIAYFSAEFGIHECLPLYAGGLGILAGDHLKSASDLGIGLVGVGLLYQRGYFRQYLNIDGWQQEVYLENDFANMPVERVCNEQGEALTIGVGYPNRTVYAQVWQVLVGRVRLYLLDTNIAANSREDRIITGSLYGGDREMRIRQEIMLGIGGVKALAAMGVRPSVCHMNEGHAAFMALERIAQLRHAENVTFDEAAEVVKAGNIFTVHTPVKAGNDEFRAEMVDKYFADYYSRLGIDRERFLGLGRIRTDDETESFKMPVLALRLSSLKNGVSRLHGQISRKMWAGLWQGVPVNEVPISSVTNGVHVKSWLSNEMNSLYERYLGPDWAERIDEVSVWENIDQIPDEEFWRAHQRCKEQLVGFARSRLRRQVQRRGTYHAELNWAEEVLDPEALIIGFARRFAAYKRGDLLLQQPERLVRLLKDRKRPVQLVFAGKAHPRDVEGKEIIRRLIHFANEYEMRRRVVFLEDYDITMAKVLVRGVDVWLNNPRRPMEASGTSGMKAAVNGALNISTPDGWWCEGYRREGGWVIGAGESYDDTSYQDMVEAKSIYDILERELIPLFYRRKADGLPRGWIRQVKNSVKWIAPRFSARRMVTEYRDRFYKPALERWGRLSTDSMSKARLLSAWNSHIKEGWPEVAIQNVETRVRKGDESFELGLGERRLTVGSQLTVRALVRLGSIAPEEVSVELYYGRVDAWENIQDGSAVRMDCEGTGDKQGTYWFSGMIPCRVSGRQGLSLRVLPRHEDLLNAYEPGLVLWDTAQTASAVVMG